MKWIFIVFFSLALVKRLSCQGQGQLPMVEDFYQEFNKIEFPFSLGSVINFNLSNETSCGRQLNLLKEQQSVVLLQMFDASGKIPSGLLQGNFFELGNFGECYEIKRRVKQETIYGKYCLGTFPIYEALMAPKNQSRIQPRRLGTLNTTIGPHLALCIPATCSAATLTNLTGGFMEFHEKFCYSQLTEPSLDWGAITTIAILAFFSVLVILSTIYDLYHKSKGVPILILAFSARYNGDKLLSKSSNPDNISCINGIKALCMMWVIIGHIVLNHNMGPVNNISTISDWLHDPFNMIWINATVSVDSFLAITGIVTVYVFLKGQEKSPRFNVVFYYIHRYIRLTPSYAIVILIHVALIRHLGSGPTWNGVEDFLIVDCQNYWWAALLYIQNFFADNNTCVPQTWYLSVDFQIFLFTPLVLIPLKRRPKLAIAILSFLIILGTIIPFGVAYYNRVPALMFTLDDHSKGDIMKFYYKQTYIRFGPYCIGMLCGYLIYKNKKSKNIHLSEYNVLIVWMIVIGGLLACLYSGHSLVVEEYDVWTHSLAAAFIRNGWTLFLCLGIFLCSLGYGGFLNKFLSLHVFEILTKLSYSMYLLHYAITTMRYASSKQGYYISNSVIYWSFWGDFAMTLISSVFLTLMFESPMILIERFIFSNKK